MKALDRKLLRDLRLMWSQAITIALVVACGVTGFITSFSAYDALSWSRDLYYSESRFADVFATLKRAPRAMERRLETIAGAAHIETGIAHIVPIDLPGVSDPIVGQLIGLDPRQTQRLNRVHLRSGRLMTAQHSGVREVLVSEGFANARQLTPGDRLHALINGKREALVIVGIALSPEYIFAGLGGSPDQRGFGVFWMDRQALAAAYDMEGAFNRVAVRARKRLRFWHATDQKAGSNPDLPPVPPSLFTRPARCETATPLKPSTAHKWTARLSLSPCANRR